MFIKITIKNKFNLNNLCSLFGNIFKLIWRISPQVVETCSALVFPSFPCPFPPPTPPFLLFPARNAQPTLTLSHHLPTTTRCLSSPSFFNGSSCDFLVIRMREMTNERRLRFFLKKLFLKRVRAEVSPAI